MLAAMAIATLVLLLIALALLAVLALRAGRDARTRDDLARRLEERSAELAALQVERATLAADLQHERRTAAEKLRLLEDAEARLKTAFEALALRIVEDRGQALAEQSRERLAGLLQPLKEQLESFRRRVDEVHQRDTEQSARLLAQVRQLQELSNRVSDEANHLARAIAGNAKRQGDWGELIVERIFEASGLERGREYDAQVALRAEDGAVRRPDFIVHLPGGKAVVVDAKVSLTAFARHEAAEDETARAAALEEHLRSVRDHIRELRDKDYAGLLGNRTLDFVIMCIPLEPAYQAALRADPELVYDLARTPVVVTGPTTLMITLKLIAQIWRREHESRHAEVIADRAGRLYDQVALVAEAMLESRKRLKDATESVDTALRRLAEGKGNLVGRVEELRKLGAKVNRTLPAAVAPAAAAGEEAPELPEAGPRA